MHRITNNLFESIKEVISVDKEKEPVLLNEKVEELDELKKSTLGNYIKRASGDAANKMHDASAYASIATNAQKTDASSKEWMSAAHKLSNKAQSRLKGIDKATDKLTKEEAEELDTRGVAEDFEVDEATGVTNYNPKSQGGTRKELLAKYHKTKDSKDAEAARKAGATQKELHSEEVEEQGVSETSDYFRRREREEAIISGQKPARKKQPAQTSDYARRREQEKKAEKGVAEGLLAEMDKSAPQPGRDGRVSHSTYGSRDKDGSKGPEKEAKPITAKKAKQDALDILKKQGVAEGRFSLSGYSHAAIKQKEMEGELGHEVRPGFDPKTYADRLRRKYGSLKPPGGPEASKHPGPGTAPMPSLKKEEMENNMPKNNKKIMEFVIENIIQIEIPDNLTYQDYLDAVNTIVNSNDENDQQEIVTIANEAFENGNLEIIAEAELIRSGILEARGKDGDRAEMELYRRGAEPSSGRIVTKTATGTKYEKVFPSSMGVTGENQRAKKAREERNKRISGRKDI